MLTKIAAIIFRLLPAIVFRLQFNFWVGEKKIEYLHMSFADTAYCQYIAKMYQQHASRYMQHICCAK